MTDNVVVKRTAPPSIAGDEAWIGPASYWQPRHLPTSAWLQHAPFGFWLIDATRPRSIVELGTHLGFSYFVFCEAIVRLGLDTSARALDTWAGDDQAGFYAEDVFQSVSTINESEYAGFSRLIRGYFDEALDEIPDESVDLLHFDGRHGYEDITHDFEAWLPKLSRRGVAIFHDVAEHQDGFGVWRFWEDVSRRYPSFAFEHEHGLGVLGVGVDIPDPMRRFFAVADREPETIRRAYESLGAEITRLSDTHARANELVAMTAQRDANLNALKAERELAASLTEQIDELRRSTSWRLTRPVRAIGGFVHRT